MLLLAPPPPPPPPPKLFLLPTGCFYYSVEKRCQTNRPTGRKNDRQLPGVYGIKTQKNILACECVYVNVHSLFPFSSWSKYGSRNYFLSGRKGRYLPKERNLQVPLPSVASICWHPGALVCSFRSDKATPVGHAALGTKQTPLSPLLSSHHNPAPSPRLSETP